MNLADLTNQPRRLTVAGVAYLIHPFALDDFGKLQRWVDGRRPNPFEVAGAEIRRAEEAGTPYPVAQQKFLNQLAMEAATRPKPLLGTPEADELATSVAGLCEMIRIAIGKGDPGFDEARAEALFRAMTVADLNALIDGTTVGQVLSAPKAPTPTGGPTTATTTNPAPPTTSGPSPTA